MLTRRETMLALGSVALWPTALHGMHGTNPWTPELGVCCGADRADTVAAAGGSFIEVSCGRELDPDGIADDKFIERASNLRKMAVPARCANGFLPGRFQATGPDADHEKLIAYAERVFNRARLAGLSIITFGSSGARSIPDDFPVADADLQFTALLARLAEPARQRGLTICVEPLRRKETNYINRVAHAWRLVRAVNHPNIGITADIYHMLCGDESPDAIRDAAHFIHHVHIAEPRDRRAPGTTAHDFTSYFDALRDIDYKGRVSIECRWRDFNNEVTPALETLRQQTNAAQRSK